MPTTLEVLEAIPISPSIKRVRFFAYDLLNTSIDPGSPVVLDFPAQDSEPPSSRRFTLLDFDSRTGDLLIDFVVHSSGGVAAKWARVATTGNKLAMSLTGEGAPQLPAGARKVVLAGDASALPALSVIAAQLEPRQVADILVEVPSPGDVRAFASRAALNVEWLVPAPADPRPLPRAVRKLPVDNADFWWVACETVSAQAVSEHLSKDRGITAERMSVASYWQAQELVNSWAQ